MAKQKKNAKYGRNSRSNSSKLQRQRTEKNKRVRIERAPKKGIGHTCPKRPDTQPFIIVVFRARKERVYIS